MTPTLTEREAQTIVAIAALAAAADGHTSDAERSNILNAAANLGLSREDPRLGGTASPATLQALIGDLSTNEAKVAAYDVAAAVCHVDGPPNVMEATFLTELSRALGAVPGLEGSTATLGAAASASANPSNAHSVGPSDAFILDQAILAAACELLPERLSTMAVLPIQMRMAYSIGQRHGQKLDGAQIKDLALALGIGAAGNTMEGIVRGVLGGLGKGLLGNLFGGATKAAASIVVTFATTYALGHAAEQYYAQGRKLSMADLKSLFTRFQGEARTLFPQIEGRVKEVAAATNLQSVLAGLRR